MSTDVVKEQTFGVFKVQILEGPTDNPIQVRLIGGEVNGQESYTFGINGEGWNILVDILALKGRDRSTIPYHLSCLLSLVRNFPTNFGLLKIDLSSAKDWTKFPEGTYLLHRRLVYLKHDVLEECTDCRSITPNIIQELGGEENYLCGQCDIGG